MQYNVFYYRLMTHTLKDSQKKRAKEINKFQKQPFTYVPQGVLKNFAIFTGNTCVGVSLCNFSKKTLQQPSELAKKIDGKKLLS